MLGYDEMRARLTRRFGSVELASDALHEAWLQIESAALDGTLRSPKHYLLRIAANIALKRLAADKRFVTLSDAKLAVGIVDHHPDPERASLARSDVQALARALADLTPRRRDILLASRLEGTPLREIAERLGISQRLVEIELKHALAHCALRLKRQTVQRFGPRPPQGSQEKESEAEVVGREEAVKVERQR
ncbi:sigma-70 family RNA polymerase sigma factor [Microbacteriaceae bacterium K1510]|nr:sigma-70 family RNA polymerase sigma factor [Microbacteriaceae bacterium K1510]